MRTRIFALAAILVALAACAPTDRTPLRTSASAWSATALADLRAVALAAPQEGLPVEGAALDELDRLVRSGEPNNQAAFEKAGDLFDTLAREFAAGATSPRESDPEWRLDPPAGPDLSALHAQLAQGVLPSALLSPLLPHSPEYAALRAELARVVAEPPGNPDTNEFDREMRIEKLRANLERWRWLPREFEDERIEVRVAEAQVMLYRSGALISSHIAIVGAPRTPTPSFRAALSSITLNPSWTPPNVILRRELAPKFQRSPSEAERQGFEVFDETGASVPLAAVDWTNLPPRYVVRQRPGPMNALGQIRFDLPNPFAVYLHDTPNRDLFTRAQRTLSHGCVRIQDPVGLAEALLSDPAWPRSALESAIADTNTRRIPLAVPLPIYVLYLTATLNEEGKVVYFKDSYHRDQRLVAALDGSQADLVMTRLAHVSSCAAQANDPHL